MEKYLYFRAVADQDADDGIADSAYIPAKRVTGIVPTSVTALTIYFESVLNDSGNQIDDEDVTSDSVTINCTQGKVKEVMLGVEEDVVAYYDSDKNEWADNFDNILKEVTDKYGSWIQDVAIATYQKIERQRKLIHEDN